MDGTDSPERPSRSDYIHAIVHIEGKNKHINSMMTNCKGLGLRGVWEQSITSLPNDQDASTSFNQERQQKAVAYCKN